MTSPGKTGLADFIAANSAHILAEWVEFAKTCGVAGAQMDRAALRDHALEMLRIIVSDLRTPQTKTEQEDKSKGSGGPDAGATDTAAANHGAGRAESGFSVGEMVAEYRALRASVIRLWTQSEGGLTSSDIEDLMRFNEAIDQALAESITRYTEDIDRSKEMFLAILGHDLRTPLGAIMMASEFMLEKHKLDESSHLLANIVRSAKRMNQMVADLLDFTRSRLGGGVPISRHETDLAKEAKHAVAEVGAAHPKSVLTLESSGDLRGNWDAARIGQVLANLLSNAVQHGSPQTLIRVSIRGEEKEVILQVQSDGPAIPPSEIQGLFSPFKRLRKGELAADASSSLGLGLYIVGQIVTAHGGTIEVRSSDLGGTSFNVRLPR